MLKTKCEVCGSKQNEIIDVREMMFGTKHIFQYISCKHCGSLTLQNIPENLGDYYPDDYYSFADETQKGFRKWVKLKIEQYSLERRGVFGFLLSSLFGQDSNFRAIRACNPDKQNTQVLDIGCGGGFLLKKLSQHGFTNLEGIDPYVSEDIVTKTITIRKASVGDIVRQDKRYDVIILSHVLEHMENPNRQIQDIKSLLSETGRLIIRVPISSSHVFKKYKSNWFQIDAPRHLFIPSLKGMNLLSDRQNLIMKEVFFDSMSIQFTASENYAKNIPLKDQSNLPFFKRFSPKRIYYSIISRKLNRLQKGDQATFVLSK